MLWHQNSGAKPLPLNSGAKLHFADVAPLLKFGTKKNKSTNSANKDQPAAPIASPTTTSNGENSASPLKPEDELKLSSTSSPSP
ncbi:hypothetical protein Tco_0613442 [Tanacetum coccineum]